MLVNFPARVSFPAFFTPQAVQGSEDLKYGGKFIIDPADKATVAKLDKVLEQVAEEKWAKKAPAILANFQRTGKKPDVFFVKEPYKNKDGEPWNGFEDMFYVTAGSKTRPLVVDQKKSPLTADDGKPKAGDYAMVQADIWAQDNQFGRAVRATLKIVQFAREGESLGGGSAADLSSLDEIEDEDASSFV